MIQYKEKYLQANHAHQLSYKKKYLPHGKFCPLEAENKACAPLVILTSQEMSIDRRDMQQEVT